MQKKNNKTANTDMNCNKEKFDICGAQIIRRSKNLRLLEAPEHSSGLHL